MKKETDIDDLARMVAEGFSAMSAQFTTQIQELRIENNERFDGLEKVVHDTNRRIDTVVVPTLDDHARRIKDLELAAA